MKYSVKNKKDSNIKPLIKKKLKHEEGGEFKKPLTTNVLDTVDVIGKKPIYKEPLVPVRKLGDLRNTYGDFSNDPNIRIEIKQAEQGKTFMPASLIKPKPKPTLEKGGELKKSIKEVKKGTKLTKDYIKEAKTKPGGSNVGNKKFADGKPRKGPYVGPSGGAPKGSFPIPDKKHAKSALSLAHNAPNPSGIKTAVYKKYPTLKHRVGGIISNIFDISKILNIWKK